MLGHLVSNAGYSQPMAQSRPGWLRRLLTIFSAGKIKGGPKAAPNAT